MIGRFRQAEPEPNLEPKGFDDFDLRLGDVMRGERATMGKSLLDVQRELKIKATYIAAIENADPSAFETPGFIAGYVRSYARYLQLDPEWAWKSFCAESRFETAHGMSAAASSKRAEPSRLPDRDRPGRDPFAEGALNFPRSQPGFFASIEPGAIGSTAVLLGLIGLIGYGGYAVLNEVQKVQFVPVEQAPGVTAQLDPLEGATGGLPEGDADSGVETARAEGFDRLYRPEPLDVPVMVARDGPIATLDPRRIGNLAEAADDRMGRDVIAAATPATDARPGAGTDPSEIALAAAAGVPEGPIADLPEGAGERPQVVADAKPELVLFAVRPSWVRVRAADGTTLYEKIMQPGDRFTIPATEEPATLRSGESGAIYFAVNGETYGPAGGNGQVTSNIALAPEPLTERYQVADLARDRDLERVVAELSIGETGPAPTE